MIYRRNLLKIIGLTCMSLILYPYKFVFSETKKIINQKKINKQKDIMFDEGTEKPFSSELLKEKRKGFRRSLIKSVETGANGTQDYVIKKGLGKNKVATTRQ